MNKYQDKTSWFIIGLFLLSSLFALQVSSYGQGSFSQTPFDLSHDVQEDQIALKVQACGLVPCDSQIPR